MTTGPQQQPQDGGNLSERTAEAIRAVLSGERRGGASFLLFAGPAVIASIAYMDPGNFATNIQAGSRYGYTLLWVVLMANLIAMLFQALSAKLGVVTGRNLAEMCRDRFPTWVVWPMWVVSEVAAMATDLAEFLGGAIGLALLLDMPLLAGMAVTAVVTYTILLLERSGFRTMEIVIGGLVVLIGLCYVIAYTAARRRRVPQAGEVLEPGGGARPGGRRPGQHGDGDDGRCRVPPGA